MKHRLVYAVRIDTNRNITKIYIWRSSYGEMIGNIDNAETLGSSERCCHICWLSEMALQSVNVRASLHTFMDELFSIGYYLWKQILEIRNNCFPRAVMYK